MKYKFVNTPVHIRDNHVFRDNTNECLGYFYEDEYGNKYVLGPSNKGTLTEINDKSDVVEGQEP